MRLTRCFAIPLLWLFSSLLASAATGSLQIAVRDFDTHYAVKAQIKLDGPESVSLTTGESGISRLSLQTGSYAMEISAAGYKPMTSQTTIFPGNNMPETFMLNPLNPPIEQQELPSRLKSGFTLLHGYAVNDLGQPVEGVTVRLRKAGVETTTNYRGYYELSAPTPAESAPDVPGTDTLIAQRTGYKTIINQNIVVAGEDGGGWILDMQQGAGVKEVDETHHLLKNTADSPEPSTPAGWSSEPTNIVSEPSLVPATISLPANIRVGLSCPKLQNGNPDCSHSCTSMTQYALERLVAQVSNPCPTFGHLLA